MPIEHLRLPTGHLSFLAIFHPPKKVASIFQTELRRHVVRELSTGITVNRGSATTLKEAGILPFAIIVVAWLAAVPIDPAT